MPARPTCDRRRARLDHRRSRAPRRRIGRPRRPSVGAFTRGRRLHRARPRAAAAPPRAGARRRSSPSTSRGSASVASQGRKLPRRPGGGSNPLPPLARTATTPVARRGLGEVRRTRERTAAGPPRCSARAGAFVHRPRTECGERPRRTARSRRRAGMARARLAPPRSALVGEQPNAACYTRMPACCAVRRVGQTMFRLLVQGPTATPCSTTWFAPTARQLNLGPVVDLAGPRPHRTSSGDCAPPLSAQALARLRHPDRARSEDVALEFIYLFRRHARDGRRRLLRRRDRCGALGAGRDGGICVGLAAVLGARLPERARAAARRAGFRGRRRRRAMRPPPVPELDATVLGRRPRTGARPGSTPRPSRPARWPRSPATASDGAARPTASPRRPRRRNPSTP